MQRILFVLLSSLTLFGCTSTTSKKVSPSAVQHEATIINHNSSSNRNPEALTPDLYPEGAQPTPEPVIRYGRYNLTTAKPTAEQQDLMAQIITTNIPGNVNNPTVKDAMSYVMTRSGYDLCPTTTSKEVRILYTRSLPAAHYKLGPITLRNALQILAGPAYKVQIDEVNRRVCFMVRDDYQLTQIASPKVTQAVKAPEVKKDHTGAK